MSIKTSPLPPGVNVEQAKQLQKQQDSADKVKGDNAFKKLMVEPKEAAPVSAKVVNGQLRAGSTKAVAAEMKIAEGVKVAKLGDPEQPDIIKRVVTDLVDGQKKLDGIIQKALNGKNFSSQELLAIQAQVYRFSQELELTSKVIERATGGIKQLMNTQV